MFKEILGRFCLVVHWACFLVMVGTVIGSAIGYVWEYLEYQERIASLEEDFPMTSPRFNGVPADAVPGDIIRSSQTGRWGRLMPDNKIELLETGDIVVSPRTGISARITENLELDPVQRGPSYGEYITSSLAGVLLGVFGWVFRFVLTGSKAIFPWGKN